MNMDYPASPDIGLRTSTRFAWRAGPVLLAVLACYEAWATILKASVSAESSGAGLMAIVASAYLFWLRRDWLTRAGEGSHAALILMFASALAYLYGLEQRFDALAHGSAILFAFGALCSALPPLALRKLAPCAVALMFAIPIPGTLVDLVSLPMQLVDAAVVEAAGQAAGLPVARNGTLIAINGTTVDIDQGCDGLRLVWPMLLAAYVAAATGIATRGLQLLICLAAIPLALILNAIRLIITTFVYGYASASTAATVHDLLGWFMVISAGFLPLLLTGMAPPSRLPASKAPDHAQAPTAPANLNNLRQLLPSMAMASGLLLLSPVVGTTDISPVGDDILRQRIAKLPYKLDQWIGQDQQVPRREREILNADALVQRVYREPVDNRELVVLVAYHRDGRLAIGHQAPRCYRTRGWGVTSQNTVNWTVNGMPLQGQAYLLSRGNAKMTVFELFAKPSLHDELDPTRATAGDSRALLRVQFLVSGEQTGNRALSESIDRFLRALAGPADQGVRLA